jgi:hypothetical protein
MIPNRWAKSQSVFNLVVGPKGTPGDYRQQRKPKQHYAVSPGHWAFFIAYLGPPGEYLAENTEAGHKSR